MKKGYALVSVFDKKGIEKFAKILGVFGYKIIATDGTRKELFKNKIPSIPAEKISKNPEGLDGCIKTISFNIEAGILFDRLNPTHVKEADALNVLPIDIVICNFPPIKEVVKNLEDFNIRNVDVGGPLMVRAAATNFKQVLVIVDPNDYKRVGRAILDDKVTYEFKQRLARKAFIYTCQYDSKIIECLNRKDFKVGIKA